MKFNTILIKLPTEFVLEINKLSLNFIKKNKQARMVKNSLKKRNEERIALWYIKINLKYKIIKTRSTGKNKFISWGRQQNKIYIQIWIKIWYVIKTESQISGENMGHSMISQ